MNPQSVLITVEGITVEASDDGIAPQRRDSDNGILVAASSSVL